MKKSVSVSNLTLDLWLDYVRPVLRDAGMLEEVPAKDDWHEYTAEVIDEATADEITHCMTVACFNAHGAGKYATIEEAAQLVYQMEVSAKYRKETAEVIATIRAALAIKVADAIAATATATDEPAQTESKEEGKEMTTLEKIAADMKTYYADRSAWDRGVATIAADLLGEYANNYGKNAAAPTMADLLNGADNWSQYSWGGCYLVYDSDIAELLCTPSELKRTRNGERRPNSREEWLDVQARALNQAARRIINSASRVCKEV